ncbi:hypothetical protein ABIB85_004289 [Bradyrhizobium sp. JR1.5]|uniref:hypothetical protein n=1 Tax=unclassified Bradyrhizobium TaxID=2631580 RepID=UPI003396FFF7
MMMELVQRPPRRHIAPIVFVGRDRHGNWVAREQNGIFGGIFVNRAQAFKYALAKNGDHPESVIEVSREIELDGSTSRQLAENEMFGATRRPDGGSTG